MPRNYRLKFAQVFCKIRQTLRLWLFLLVQRLLFNRYYQIAICFGIIAHAMIAQIWPLSFLFGLIITVLLIKHFITFRCSLIIVMLMAFSYANWYANSALSSRLSDKVPRQDIMLTGHIASLVKKDSGYTQFDFKVRSAQVGTVSIDHVRQIRLSDYSADRNYQYGQKWRLIVRLKRPHGQVNPVQIYDSEKNALVNRIDAKGYIRQAELLAMPTVSLINQINQLRQYVVSKIASSRVHPEVKGLMSALLVGVRTQMQERHWRTLKRTGTSHLFAISGLHVGFVALISAVCFKLVLQIFKRHPNTRPLQDAVLVSAFIVALFYAALAGFSLPTQRALIAIMVLGFYRLTRSNYQSWDVFWCCMMVVLLLFPLNALSASFWLSFSAVACLILIFELSHHRFKVEKSILPKIIFWCYVQLALFILLQPVTYSVFSELSLFSPIANVIAIPVVAFVIVPIGLVSVLLLLFNMLWPIEIVAILAQMLLEGASMVLLVVWWFLKQLSQFEFASVSLVSIPLVFYVFWLAMISCLLLPRRYLKIIALSGLVIMFLWRPDKLEQGEFRVTQFDVGQGLSIFVETRNHSMLYDVGAAFASGFNYAKVVLLPYLIQTGYQRLDMLVLSHRHNDHSGGRAVIENAVLIDQKITGAPVQFAHYDACVRGQSWSWDGVTFRVIWPTKLYLEEHPEGGNNNSCVIKVSSEYGSALLTADIEMSAELALLEMGRHDLESQILQVPHQGSRTSSSWSFLDAVNAKYGFISSGYLNRFSHPHQKVVQRLKNNDIEVMNTATHGGIVGTVGSDGINIETARQEKPYWRY